MIGNEPPEEPSTSAVPGSAAAGSGAEGAGVSGGGVPRRRPSNLSGIVGQGRVAEGARPQFQRRGEAAPTVPESSSSLSSLADGDGGAGGSWWRRRWVIVPAAVLAAGAIGVPFWLAVEKAPSARSSPAGMPLSGDVGPGPVRETPQPSTSPVPSAAVPTVSALPPSPVAARASASASAAAAAAAPGAAGATPKPEATTTKPKPPQATGKPGTGADLALNRPVTRSGAEAAHFEATMAVDGDDTSRWGSAWKDGEWIAVNLGDVWSVSSVEVLWEHAHPSQYRIDVSTDGTTWKAAKSGIPGREGLITTSLGATPARWVRLSTERRPDSQYGVSLWSLRVR